MIDMVGTVEHREGNLADVALRVAEEVIVHRGEPGVQGWADEALALLETVQAARRTADTTN